MANTCVRIFLKTSYRFISYLRHSISDGDWIQRIKIRCYKMIRASSSPGKYNCGGIPEQVVDKIFQPFFTTKPTGSGTGLGLSLSYDIVKVHGGELKVKSEEGSGSEFSIRLPIKN